MNLLFLTAPEGHAVVLNMDNVLRLEFIPASDSDLTLVSSEGEKSPSRSMVHVLETPAAIRAQLERMVHPLVAVEPLPAAQPMDPKTGRRMELPVHADAAKTIPFVCPKCGGTIKEGVEVSVICISCQTVSFYDAESRNWKSVLIA